MSYNILIIEDELSLLNILVAYFKKQDYTVFSGSDGLEGLQLFRKNEIDLVITDVMMPNINGWEVVKSIRQTSSIPIIMLTALDSEVDQLRGFELEVDDYVTKPFSPAVLVAKANALLRREKNATQNKNNALISYDNLQINFSSRSVHIKNEEIYLSKTEFDLLSFLVKNENIALDRVTILDEVWGLDVYVEERVVDTYIKVLRKKLKEYGSSIKTIFGVGYKFIYEKN